MKTKKNPTPNLPDMLRTIPDYRRSQGKRHALVTVLLIVIMAIMAGSKSERAVARFAKNNKDSLIKHLRIERKEVPTRYVIKGILERTDFSLLHDVFYQWASKMIRLQKKDIVSIDGKVIKGTENNPHSSLQNFTSLVSVFASKRKQALAAEKIHTGKESEIPAVKKLIEMLNMKDITFTLDALHCQEKTVSMIKKTGNHYIVGVKENQKGLCEEIRRSIKKRSKSIIILHQERKKQRTIGRKKSESISR